MPKLELTRFAKPNGEPLTKRIWLDASGSLKSDGSACIMGHGIAERLPINNINDLAQAVGATQSNQALALGRLRRELPNRVEIITKRQLRPNDQAIARTAKNIGYRPGAPAAALIDYDRKGMPPSVTERIRTCGGLWPTLLTVLPALARVAYVDRDSTSAGLYRADTGEVLPGSGGQHIYIEVKDGADIERFLRVLHGRCWLAGFGWYIIGKGGQLLDRSIVDRMVFGSERLVFEGAPVLVLPLAQDLAKRQPKPHDGESADTLAICLDLDVAERAHLDERKLKAAYPLKGEATRVRREFEQQYAEALAQRTGMSLRDAKHQIGRQCDGSLLPNVVLPFDDEDLAGATVGDVLADPERFEGATLADPIEGVDYGRCIARIMRRDDGTSWIHSFAHGRATYELRHNAASVRAAIDQADEKDAAKILIEMIPHTDFDVGDQDRLRKYAAERAEIGLRDLNRLLKSAERERAAKHKREAKERQARERSDPRPQIARPAEDADWLPMMGALNSVISKSAELQPSARDIDDATTESRLLALPKMHAFTSSDQGAPQ